MKKAKQAAGWGLWVVRCNGCLFSGPQDTALEATGGNHGHPWMVWMRAGQCVSSYSAPKETGWSSGWVDASYSHTSLGMSTSRSFRVLQTIAGMSPRVQRLLWSRSWTLPLPVGGEMWPWVNRAKTQCMQWENIQLGGFHSSREHYSHANSLSELTFAASSWPYLDRNFSSGKKLSRGMKAAFSLASSC